MFKVKSSGLIEVSSSKELVDGIKHFAGKTYCKSKIFSSGVEIVVNKGRLSVLCNCNQIHFFERVNRYPKDTYKCWKCNKVLIKYLKGTVKYRHIFN